MGKGRDGDAERVSRDGRGEVQRVEYLVFILVAAERDGGFGWLGSHVSTVRAAGLLGFQVQWMVSAGEDVEIAACW